MSFCIRIIKSDQVVESDALLSAAHVPEESVISNQQEGTGILLVVVDISFVSVKKLYKKEAGTKKSETWIQDFIKYEPYG